MIQVNENIGSTLCDTSKDDEKISVIIDSQEVYNFDKLTECVANMYRKNQPLCSCDALYVNDKGELILIEFKNARKSRVPVKSLHQKAFDSFLTLLVTFGTKYSAEEITQKTRLIFVYNNDGVVEKEETSVSFDKLKDKMAALAVNKPEILFGLSKYKGAFYGEVITVEKKDFIQHTYKQIFGHIPFSCGDVSYIE